MTIQINPEQEMVIGQAINAGLIDSPAQAVEVGVGAIRLRLEAQRRTPAARNLVDLFARSPFAGMAMNFERDPDTGREATF